MIAFLLLIFVLMLTCYGWYYVTANFLGWGIALYDSDQAWKKRKDRQ